jgi:hypothetical protein
VRGRPQYPFNPPAVEDFLALVLAYILALPKIQCSQQPVMPNLMKLEFSLGPFSGATTYFHGDMANNNSTNKHRILDCLVMF